MVAAARDLVAIYVDCTLPTLNAELCRRFDVKLLPTVLFLDSRGTLIGPLVEDPAPAAVRAQLQAIVRGDWVPPPPEDRSAWGERVRVVDATLVDGLERARAERKLLGVVFCDPVEPRREEHTELVIEALRAEGLDSQLRQLCARFVWIRRPLCDDLGLNTEEADAYLLRRSPSVMLFDPWAERPEGSEDRPFPSILTTVELELEAIRASLERATIEAARAGHPPPPPREPTPR